MLGSKFPFLQKLNIQPELKIEEVGILFVKLRVRGRGRVRVNVNVKRQN